MATYDYGIRQGLNSQGVDNSRIGYSNGYVTVDGKNFMKADLNNQGTSYTNQQNFNTAWNSFNPAQPTNTPTQPASNPMVQAANSVKVGTTSSYTPYSSPTQNTLSQIQDLLNKNSGFQYKGPDPFTYDPQSDPAYQSQLAEAKRNIADQQVDTNAVLRAQGQGKSSYSELVQQQIGDKTLASLADTLVPQLMQQAYQRYNDSANRDLQVQQLNYGTQQDAVANLANLYGLQDKEYFQNPITEAQLTGNYLPNEAKQAISNLLELKQQAEAKGITAEQRVGLSQQADVLRAKLQALGVDPSFYGADKSYSQASQSNPGIRTLAGQAQDLASKQANLQAAATYMDATGKVVTPQSDWSGYARQAANPNAMDTLAGQQLAYQKARDAISDQQWKMKFDEDVRQFGLNYALSNLQETNQQAYREAQLALSQDDNTRAWLTYGDSLNQAAQSKYSGMSANQIYDALKSTFTKKDPNTDQLYIPNDQATKQQIYQQVMASGLPDGQDVQVMTMLGLNPKDIENFDKQYGVASGN
ncbi:hypothetical protein P9847_18725 [Paenibacillus chibensis]|uniref:Uncharacterized protein n=1 Tax=Paenibacillus chibensis TaxID=59846 RepID=A0ABU6PZ06_9BACL|nr:hypothetical protein [Paenibacillus chibensis]